MWTCTLDSDTMMPSDFKNQVLRREFSESEGIPTLEVWKWKHSYLTNDWSKVSCISTWV